MKNKELGLILFFVLIFVGIRSIHFKEFLNFSFDQAWDSTRCLEIWKNKEITLVGPGNSIIANGKQMIQGSINYYFQLFFLLLGKFDPIVSSYLLMVYVGIMIIPLYYGTKLLHGKKMACFIVILYSLLSYYIDFTRLFFGPLYQLSFLTLLILAMGIHKKYKKAVFLFIVFILTGVLMQFHYQAFVVFFILFFYYLTKNKNRLQASFIMMFGMILGYLPMLIFEIKNDFYNTKVLFEYIQFAKKSSDLFLIPHRYLSISLILLTIAAPLYKKLISYKKLFFLGIALLIIDLFIYLPIPKSAFGMSENWNYLMEKKAYGIIKKEGLHDFNIVNHIYDNKSVVIKYLLKLDKYNFNYDDYYHNQYLFVISSTDKIFNDPAYEINNFQPNKKIKQWRLNNTYNLYLFERIRKKSI